MYERERAARNAQGRRGGGLTSYYGSVPAISGGPVDALFAIPGLLLLAALVIWLPALRIRKLEVNYGAE